MSLKVVEVKLIACLHLLGKFLSLFDVNGFLDVFYQSDDIAHAEDAACHSFGIKGFQTIDFFRDTDKFNRFTGCVGHRQSGTTAAVTIKLREDNACQRKSFVKGLRGLNSCLTQHGVSHEHCF